MEMINVIIVSVMLMNLCSVQLLKLKWLWAYLLEDLSYSSSFLEYRLLSPWLAYAT